jgi:hypothetical protein
MKDWMVLEGECEKGIGRLKWDIVIRGGNGMGWYVNEGMT